MKIYNDKGLFGERLIKSLAQSFYYNNCPVGISGHYQNTSEKSLKLQIILIKSSIRMKKRLD